MGVHRHGGTMPGAVTPICEECGVSLCWDLGLEEYQEDQAFWDAWRCRDCNDGPMSLRAWKTANGNPAESPVPETNAA